MYVPPHVLAVVRVLASVTLVLQLGHQGRLEAASVHQGPVQRLEPGVAPDLARAAASSAQPPLTVPRQQAAEGRVERILWQLPKLFKMAKSLKNKLKLRGKVNIRWTSLTKSLVSSCRPGVLGQQRGEERIMS